jgi:polyisoprenoid-binding protein YceI
VSPRVLLASALLGTLAAVSGCDDQPGKNKARATTAEATSIAAATTATPEGATKYAFSDADSKLEWTGAKVSAKHDGSFKTFHGTIEAPESNPEKAAVHVDIDAASISVEPPKLNGHLKSKDFFDVESFPKATFQSTQIKAGGDKGATHTVTGNFTLHGVTKAISFPATIKVAGERGDVDAEFVINRRDFGLVYPGKADDLIKDDVLIKLTIRAKKA